MSHTYRRDDRETSADAARRRAIDRATNRPQTDRQKEIAALRKEAHARGAEHKRKQDVSAARDNSYYGKLHEIAEAHKNGENVIEKYGGGIV